MLENLPLKAEVFAEAIQRNETLGDRATSDGSQRLEEQRAKHKVAVAKRFEDRFGPVLNPDDEEVGAALRILDLREKRNVIHALPE
ncbi:MAG: hypothetical protein AAGE90_20880 [Pseudomonadota bacterium]